jgi:transposase
VAAPWIVDDELSAVVEPLLPVKPAGTPGPAQMDSRLVLQGILFVLITGIEWDDLPQELGSGMRCWRRLRDWQAAGAFEQIHQVVLARAARLIDFDRVMVDGSHLRAKKGHRNRSQPGRPRQDRFQAPHPDLRERIPARGRAVSGQRQRPPDAADATRPGSGLCADVRAGPVAGSPP